MKVAIGKDLRAYSAARRVCDVIRGLGHEICELGAGSYQPLDYTDPAHLVARAVSSSELDSGILMSGCGLGMSIAANKVAGVCAVVCYDEFSAERCRRRYDANVLCLSVDLIGEETVDRIVKVWLSTGFDGGRHARCTAKIRQIETEEVLA